MFHPGDRVKLSKAGAFLGKGACAGLSSTGTVVLVRWKSQCGKHRPRRALKGHALLVQRDRDAGPRWYAAEYWSR